MRGPAARWADHEYLLAAVIDRLAVLIWQQTRDGHDGKNFPKPYPRPGLVLGDDQAATNTEMIARLRAQRERLRKRRVRPDPG